MNPVEKYLHEIAETRSSGNATDETSYYPAIHTLLNELGKQLKPNVRCILQLKNTGAGNPDGGLYTPDQFQKGDTAPSAGLLPARGAIEIKPTSDDAWFKADSAQVTKYWKKYGQVLVTNYWDFVLVGRNQQGNAVKLESFRLASNEKQFWSLANHPKKAVRETADEFIEFLKRVMLYSITLVSPKDVAWFLASFARDANSRLQVKANLPGLDSIRQALQESLGLKFDGQRGEHFFRSSLVQTLFYGIFSAWVLWSKKHPWPSKEPFDWRTTAWWLRVPMIRVLFEQVATPGKLQPLELVEILDRAEATLNRVQRDEFFKRFEDEHAVQYFYEPFLEAFDPELRTQLGVWYTPPEIVKYMVARADTALRQQLGVTDGFADKNVYVLDPACGTGAYLVQVLKTIHQTLKAKGEGALLGYDVKQAAKERIFGFEILPAPFVISHLQLGLLLQAFEAPLSEDGKERAGVYLTNSLTGWEPPAGAKQHLMFPEMEEERDAAERVKLDAPILVVLGNPPYNSKPKKGKIDILYSAAEKTSPSINTAVYKENLNKPIDKGGWGTMKFNLDDLYVRFLRLAERRIAEKTGRGIVCYISNFSYLSGPSFVVMRRRLLQEFQCIYLDCMNGDSRETGKLTPEGKPDPSVFSTESNPEGIRVGTAVALMVRNNTHPVDSAPTAQVRFRQFWGAAKRKELLESLNVSEFDSEYKNADPKHANRYSFRPETVGEDYRNWPPVTALSAVAPFNGPVERRGFALISIDRQPLEARMKQYFDPTVSDQQVAQTCPPLMMTGNRIVGPDARAKILKKFQYDKTKIVQYLFKPFDLRWCYLENLRPLFSEPSPELLRQRTVPENAFFLTRDTADKSPEGPPFLYSPHICDYDCISGHSRHFPVLLLTQRDKKDDSAGQMAFPDTQPDNSKPHWRANLSEPAKQYLRELDLGDFDTSAATAGLIWLHAIAIGFSPRYLLENNDGIRGDWPRIPLPNSKQSLSESAKLGKYITDLLNPASPLPDAPPGYIRPEQLTCTGDITTVGKKYIDSAKDLEVVNGWGHKDRKGVTMPGEGKVVQRSYTQGELTMFASIGLSRDDALKQLGESACDVYLNDHAYWKNIPLNVWDYNIAGYQVIKKWLSYRETKLFGRPLTADEALEVSNVVRRLTALCLTGPKLDQNYLTVKNSCYKWPSSYRVD